MLNCIKYWLIPQGFQNLISKLFRAKGKKVVRVFDDICEANLKFKNIHQKKRCFIICSGPSIKKQNLLPLKDETSFFVSTGFLHTDYSTIHPKYHCTPDILITKRLTEDKYVKWFKQMDKAIGDTQLFLSLSDRLFIEENKLFPNRSLNYIKMNLSWNQERKEIYDLTEQIPSVQSVSIMALIIAMYMGFEKIYLLGVEHDSFKGEYKHFYINNEMTEDTVVDYKVSSILPELKGCVTLWEQYMHLNRIAKNSNISIFNSTEGGALDVFPRVKFETLFI
jgi:hypothetical protein